MSRLPDWQERLSALIAERRAAPFAWGENDCAIFACDGVLAITGTDPAAGLRAHRTAQEATKTLRQGNGVAGLAEARLGPEIAPALAQVGDVGLAELDGRDTLVLCVGMHWFGPGAAGLVDVPAATVPRAWRTE